MLIQAKQVWKLLDAPIMVTGYTTQGGVGEDVTAVVQALLTTLGLQETLAGPNQPGVVASGNNRVEVYDGNTKEKMRDSTGNEIYGRITGTPGAWTLTFYSLVDGVETAQDLNGFLVDFAVHYRFTFRDLPVDAITSVKKMVYDDVRGSLQGRVVTERLTIVNTNQVPNVSFPVSDTTTFQLVVNGKVETTVGTNPAVTATLGGTAVTWNATNAGYNLEPSDHVVAVYHTRVGS